KLIERDPLALTEVPYVCADGWHTTSVAYSASFFTYLLSVQVDRDEGRKAGLFHSHTIEHIGGLQGLPVVGDDQELRLTGQFPQDTQEAINVCVVEWSVDLVEDAKGARPEEEDPDEGRPAGEGPLSAREHSAGLEPLPARLRHELDPGVEGVAAFFGLDQLQLGSPPLEQPLEEPAEVAVDLGECLDEPVLRGTRHSTQRLLEVLERSREVVVLIPKERQPLVELAVVVIGDQIHRTDRGEALLELGDPTSDAPEIP